MAEHGTYARWNKHKRHGQQPCPACTEAQKRYVHEWRIRTGRVKTPRYLTPDEERYRCAPGLGWPLAASLPRSEGLT